MNLRTVLTFCALLVCALLVFGCGDFFVDDSDLTEIVITPASPSVLVGKKQSFVATGTLAGGGTLIVTDTATWTSSSTAVATINSTGEATGVSPGSTSIRASQGGASSSVTLTVDPPALSFIVVDPENQTININATQQFTAEGDFTDGTFFDITTSVTWTSSNTNVATINSSTGLATGVAAGTTTITATLGISDTTTLTVQ
jgi:uncharacterized protein YjdB